MRSLEDFALLNTASQLRRAADHAFDFYHGAIPLTECRRITQESYDLLAAGAKLTHHLVPLAERWSIDRLRHLGIVQHRLAPAVPEVLFIDSRDSLAAPMAATALATYARGRLNVTTAGHHPDAAVHPLLGQILAEARLPEQELFPKPLTDDAVRAADVIILLGDVPAPQPSAAPGARILRWDIPDPGDPTYDQARTLFDDLDRRALLLLADLLASTPRS
ncbi:protein-tyrosine-phosphatase [Thermocatellispora tengchongensis]|uniref:Protein-tyrosine-phosphatase n=1 Tax=Thermocatellispora tengchongensis TaxID=1073253 RepID=A0A840PK40_9ACTN|nr:arsenate reductase ArsC [Thermocatellispora tengchongensis]MBB5137437.1 protein-tyrosine-phosphatase [Thermocatellispora tengchongensis]